MDFNTNNIPNREVKYLLINITVCIYFICFCFLSVFRMISLSNRLQHYRKCSYRLHFLKPSAITSSHFALVDAKCTNAAFVQSAHMRQITNWAENIVRQIWEHQQRQEHLLRMATRVSSELASYHSKCEHFRSK